MTEIHTEGLPLFSAPPVTHLTRREDPATSKQAAAGICDHISKLQRRVLAAFVEAGPMTDERLLGLEQFAAYADSTVRTRRGELARRGLLETAGVETNERGNEMEVYQLTALGRAAAEGAP